MVNERLLVKMILSLYLAAIIGSLGLAGFGAGQALKDTSWSHMTSNSINASYVYNEAPYPRTYEYTLASESDYALMFVGIVGLVLSLAGLLSFYKSNATSTGGADAFA